MIVCSNKLVGNLIPYSRVLRVLSAQGLRDVGESIVLMGKNTMMKRSIRLYAERTGNETWNNLLDSLVGNVGLIFTKADLSEVRLPLQPFAA